MPVQLSVPHNVLSQEAHERQQVCAVEGNLLHHEHSICAVGDRVFPASKNKQVGKPPQHTQQELVVILSERSGFLNTHWMWVNSSERGWYAVLMEESLLRMAKSLPDEENWSPSGSSRVRGSISHVQ